MSWRCLEDVFKRSWRHFQNVLKTSSKRLEDVLKMSWRRFCKTSWKHLEDILKTYGQDEYIGLDQDVLKTSWRCLLKMKTKDPFKTSSSRRMFAGYPFQIVWIDLFHLNRQEFVLVVNYYSRYWEIEKLCKTDAATIIKKIKKKFTRIVLPEIIRSDNDPQYNSR